MRDLLPLRGGIPMLGGQVKIKAVPPAASQKGRESNHTPFPEIKRLKENLLHHFKGHAERLKDLDLSLLPIHADISDLERERIKLEAVSSTGLSVGRTGFEPVSPSCAANKSLPAPLVKDACATDFPASVRVRRESCPGLFDGFDHNTQRRAPQSGIAGRKQNNARILDPSSEDLC